jgi:outer membrane lipoprotein SlyB
MMKHPAKIAKHEGKKIGEAAAGGVAATAVCNGTAKVLAPCLGTAAEEAVPVAVPVMEGVAEDV